MPVDELQSSPMMSHLMHALGNGEDVGHYGRLVFVIVGQYFLSDAELMDWLKKGADCDEVKANAMVAQVKAHGYNPPKRERILQWMREQEFPICEPEGNEESCNIYKSLKFPPEVYQKIASYYERNGS